MGVFIGQLIERYDCHGFCINKDVSLAANHLYSPAHIFIMKKEKNCYPLKMSMIGIHHEKVSWSNVVIQSPMACSLLERRAMYFLTKEVKHKFVEEGLGVPERWKELYFHLTDHDLGIIGGKKNVPRTYEVLKSLVNKAFPVCCYNEQGKKMEGLAHWVDTFYYDKEKNVYVVRMSPEIMPYLVNLNKDFTSFDVGTAMNLRSKYSQKMYELCCRYGGEYRRMDRQKQFEGKTYKKRVFVLDIDKFRDLFNFEEVKDVRTNKTEQHERYRNYKNIRHFVLDAAQKELLAMYKWGASDVWFDYQAGERKGRGGKVSSIVFYVYTREHPKKGEQLPWRNGDEPLCPFEEKLEPTEKKTPAQKLHANDYYNCQKEYQEMVVDTLLKRYLTDKEVFYYMNEIRKEAMKCKDSWAQVIQVIQAKEKQPKFIRGTRQYKRNAIIDYVLKENLRDYGWSIKPPSTKKERRKDMKLIE